MAEIDEDLRSFLIADASIARKIGTRIHENQVPVNPLTGEFTSQAPFIYFVQTDDITDDCLDDSPGAVAVGTQFALEVVAQSIRDARAIGKLVRARLHLANSTTAFGSLSGGVQECFCENQRDDYQERSGATGRGFHVESFNVEVYP